MTKEDSKTSEHIIETVEHCLGMTIDMIRASDRTPGVVDARNILVQLLRIKCTRITLMEIGHIVNRSHSLVCYALNRHYDFYSVDEAYRHKYDMVIESLSGEKCETEEHIMFARVYPQGGVDLSTLRLFPADGSYIKVKVTIEYNNLKTN